MTPDATANPYLRIASARFSDGTDLAFSAGEVVVFVGPNNAGKSAALRTIVTLLTASGEPPEVIKGITPDAAGSEDDFFNVLEQLSTKHQEATSKIAFYRFSGTRLTASDVKHRWRQLRESKSKSLGEFAKLFICHLTGQNRLSAANPAKAIDILKATKTHPIHFIYDDEDLELILSTAFKVAFDEDLILHRQAGSEWPLYVGKAPILELLPGRRALPKEYQKQIEALTALHDQGDGMRSFVGVLLEVTVLNYSILLIDEPEAFLHPPQARLLSRMLVEKKKNDSQLFIATHSTDVLRGLLDSGGGKVSVVRLRRRNDINEVCHLRTEDVRNLWSDPLLRYSNVLDGLFHKKVVVCEADADCRFYEALAVAVAEKEGQPSPDALFVHCGGKQRIATLVKALRAVGVPVAAVADFDVLSEEEPLRRLIEALGGKWSEIASDWTEVRTAIASKKPALEAVDVDKEIRAVLGGVSDKYFPSEARDMIQRILRRTTPWSFAKEQGKAYVPPGKATQANARLLHTCRAHGLFIVEVGELEGFVRSVGGHGPAWVNGVLDSKDLAKDPELESARRFVKGFFSEDGHPDTGAALVSAMTDAGAEPGASQAEAAGA